ncbi:MAG: hypothetical protein ACLR43_08885 [Faecalibacillus faecis]
MLKNILFKSSTAKEAVEELENAINLLDKRLLNIYYLFHMNN